MTYLAIVSVINNRVAKFLDFENLADASTHVATHGGFVFHNVNGWKIDDLYVDGETVTESLAAGAAEKITEERNRRLALGFDYDFGDVRGTHTFATTETDMVGWREVSLGAQAAVNLGAGGNTFSLVTDTGPVNVTADEWQLILAAITTERQAIWSASFTLQAMDPIPSDYANDSYWP